MGEHTSIEDIEGFLQIDIKSTTKPSTAQVEDFIRQIDAQVNARRLSSHSSDVLVKMDVMDTNTLVPNSVAWMQAGAPAVTTGRIVVPPYMPIISVVSGTLSRNNAELNEAEDWEVLAEGPGASTDFIILNRRTANSKNYGYGFYFYSSNIPESGYQKLRATYMYGYNIHSDILGEWAMLKASEKVIFARLFSGQPMNVASYTGGSMSTYVNTEYEAQMAWIDKRTKEIENRHFPSKPIGLAVM